MSQTSRIALRALNTVHRRITPSPRAIGQQKTIAQCQIPSRRSFTSYTPYLAAQTAQASPGNTSPTSPTSTASAAATESASSPDRFATPTSPLPSPAFDESDPAQRDWSKSFHGLSTVAFPKEAADILLAPLSPDIIEIKPDGIIYMPEIHYRRILNKAFGPGAWGLAPRGDTIVTDKAVTREYALIALGRLVSIARGEQDYFSKDGIPTASEGCKSNAMVRCCKDLGIASEMWDPRYIRAWKAKHAKEVFVEHQNTKKRSKIWLRKGDPVSYPWKETSNAAFSKPAREEY